MSVPRFPLLYTARMLSGGGVAPLPIAWRIDRNTPHTLREVDMARSPLYRGRFTLHTEEALPSSCGVEDCLFCTLFKHQEPRLRPPKSSFPRVPSIGRNRLSFQSLSFQPSGWVAVGVRRPVRHGRPSADDRSYLVHHNNRRRASRRSRRGLSRIQRRSRCGIDR